MNGYQIIVMVTQKRFEFQLKVSNENKYTTIVSANLSNFMLTTNSYITNIIFKCYVHYGSGNSFKFSYYGFSYLPHLLLDSLINILMLSSACSALP
jgi:hypothetical protein